MAEPAEIVRREDHADALATIVGTGDTRAALAQFERNVKDIIAVARDRGFVITFEQDGQTREFYGMPAWQLLGMSYGVASVVEWSRPINNGYEARAIAKRLANDQVIGAAEGMCTRTEPRKQRASDHTLRATAETRAARNALRRSPLGAVLVLAGYDFADPDAPATKEQKGLLHQLARELGFSDRRAHEVAGVASFNDLTREEASELVDSWQGLVAQRAGQMAHNDGSTTVTAQRSATDRARGNEPAAADGAEEERGAGATASRRTGEDPTRGKASVPSAPTDWPLSKRMAEMLGKQRFSACSLDELKAVKAQGTRVDQARARVWLGHRGGQQSLEAEP